MSLAVTPTLSAEMTATAAATATDTPVLEAYLSHGGIFRIRETTLTDPNGEPFTVFKVLQKRSQGSFALFCNHWLQTHCPGVASPCERRELGVIAANKLVQHRFVTFSFHRKNPDGSHEREGTLMENRGKLGIIVNVMPVS